VKIVQKKDTDVIIISFADREGIIDHLEVNELISSLNIIQNSINNKSKVIIDLSNIKYIDSSGLGFLVVVNSRFKDKDCDIVFINISKKIVEILELAHIINSFNVVENKDEAFIYFNKKK